MKNLIKRIHFVLYVLLTVVLFSSCVNEPPHKVWYGNNGIVVAKKNITE